MKRFRQRIRTKAYEAEVARGVIARDAILSAAGALIILGTLTDWFTYVTFGQRVAISGLDLILRVGLYYEVLILIGIGAVFLLLPLTYHGRVRKVLPGDFIAGALSLGAILIPIEVVIRHREFVLDTVGIELFNNLGAGFFLVLLGSGVVVISLIAHPPAAHRVMRREEIKETQPTTEKRETPQAEPEKTPVPAEKEGESEQREEGTPAPVV
jgi:hypothetical protein